MFFSSSDCSLDLSSSTKISTNTETAMQCLNITFLNHSTKKCDFLRSLNKKMCLFQITQQENVHSHCGIKGQLVSIILVLLLSFLFANVIYSHQVEDTKQNIQDIFRKSKVKSKCETVNGLA